MFQKIKDKVAEIRRRDAVDRLGQKLRKDFEETAKLRQAKEIEWIESLRQYRGIYDPDVLARIQPGKSRVYPKYTRSKVIPCTAKLNNMLFPDNGKNWEIGPTPQPDLPQEVVNQIAMSLVKTDEAGNKKLPTADEVGAGILAYAKQKCNAMGVVMDDQLTELKYKKKSKKMIRSAVRYGTGILKGPVSEGHIKRSLNEQDGQFVQKKEVEYKPFVDNVPLWRFFPDMSTTEFDQCGFVFELNSMSKHELRKLSQRDDFDRDIILAHLKKNPEGDYKLRDWEIDLATIIDGETIRRTNKYEVLEFNGYLDGQDLLAIGVIGEEEADQDYLSNVWILGNRVIKADVHPIPELTDLYHLFYFEKDEASIFGEGLPRIIRDTAISICAGTRAMLDNAAMVAGPILEINTDLIPDDPEPANVHPGRVYLREGQGMEAQYPAIRAINVDARINEYLAMIAKFEQNGDMESTLPAFLIGEAAKTTNETAKGISIRSSSVNLTVDDIVKMFDEANESLLVALYKWNMEYHPDENIKGDAKVKAVGSSSLVSKEIRTQALDMFASTITPADEPYIKRRPFLVQRVKLHDLDADELINTEEEAEKIRQAQSDPEAAALQKQALAAKIGYDNAKAESMTAKAKAIAHKSGLDEDEAVMGAIETILNWRKGNGTKGQEGAGATA